MLEFLKKKPKAPEFVVINCVARCGRENCPKWIILDQTVKMEKDGSTKIIKVGKCSDVWSVYLMIELRQTIENVFGNNKKNKIIIPQ